MYQIDGLTARQVELLDILWEIDSQEDVHLFLATLDESDRLDCSIIMEALRLELIDEAINEMKFYHSAKLVLQKYTLRK